MIPIVLISSNQKQIEKYIQSFMQEQGILNANTVVIDPEGKELSINQIRQIKKDLIYEKPDKKLYVMNQFDKSSLEAQNAFLKTLEEHSSNLQFILSITNKHALLPTILSRSKIVSLDTKKVFLPDSVIFSRLEQFVEKGELGIFANQKQDEAFLEQVLYFFKGRLPHDDISPGILREILKVKNLVSQNNVILQLGIDHILIKVKRAYAQKRS